MNSLLDFSKKLLIKAPIEFWREKIDTRLLDTPLTAILTKWFHQHKRSTTEAEA